MVKVKTLIIFGWSILTGREHKGSFMAITMFYIFIYMDIYMDISICQNSLNHNKLNSVHVI